ncbi:hypothetical protein HYPSUDRAFT_207037 [Hypholoma sublateritium FD-334 SS-4]|uniref:Uncharacterized protein n=1 Tax=Hypholoma sublateritium (strain FD-334 SS-4) TaxID=945553 RepID=A0A0D2P7U2_HYPSF|nr:hypothetical protein HYPSUDRAFT_207037 [Hypholoma sublateritium FD-334 SS-4]
MLGRLLPAQGAPAGAEASFNAALGLLADKDFEEGTAPAPVVQTCLSVACFASSELEGALERSLGGDDVREGAKTCLLECIAPDPENPSAITVLVGMCILMTDNGVCAAPRTASTTCRSSTISRNPRAACGGSQARIRMRSSPPGDRQLNRLSGAPIQTGATEALVVAQPALHAEPAQSASAMPDFWTHAMALWEAMQCSPVAFPDIADAPAMARETSASAIPHQSQTSASAALQHCSPTAVRQLFLPKRDTERVEEEEAGAVHELVDVGPCKGDVLAHDGVAEERGDGGLIGELALGRDVVEEAQVDDILGCLAELECHAGRRLSGGASCKCWRLVADVLDVIIGSEAEEEGDDQKEEQSEVRDSESTPRPRQPSPVAPMRVIRDPPVVTGADWFSTAASTMSSGSSLRVGRSTNRNHLARPAKSQFSAKYDQEADAEDTEAQRSERRWEMAEEAMKLVPLFAEPSPSPSTPTPSPSSPPSQPFAASPSPSAAEPAPTSPVPRRRPHHQLARTRPLTSVRRRMDEVCVARIAGLFHNNQPEDGDTISPFVKILFAIVIGATVFLFEKSEDYGGTDEVTVARVTSWSARDMRCVCKRLLLLE